MIIPGPGHDIRPHAEPDRGFWDAPNFGGHVMVSAYIDAEPGCDQ